MRIVNGAFQVSQKYGDMAVLVDRSEFKTGPDMWYGWGMANQGTFSMQRVTDEAGNYVELKVIQPDAVLQHSDIYVFGTALEGKRLAGLGFGCSMRSFNLSFEVQANTSMTLPITLIRGDLLRSNVIPFTINGGAWESKTIQIPTDNWPGWSIRENTFGMYLEFGLAVGPEWQAPETGWRDGGLTGLPNMTNFMAGMNSLKIRNVRINYELHDADATHAACRRHYVKSFPSSVVPQQGVGNHVGALMGVIAAPGATACVSARLDMYCKPKVTLYSLNGGAVGQARCLSSAQDYSATNTICQGESGFAVIAMPPQGVGAGADMAVHFEAESWIFG